MRSVPLRVSCRSPVRCLACLKGGWPVPVPPLPGMGLCAPLRAGPRVQGVPAPGGAGGGGLCAVLPGGVAGGLEGRGGRSTSVLPSAFPGRAPKRVLVAWLSS